MSHKQIAAIALVMAFVFGAIVIVYPLIFSPAPTAPVLTPETPVN